MLVELVLVCIQKLSYFGFDNDVALLVTFGGFAEVYKEQGSHHACSVLVIVFFIILELIEYAIFLIFI